MRDTPNYTGASSKENTGPLRLTLTPGASIRLFVARVGAAREWLFAVTETLHP
ncbi:MAG TPA: hypothetical protein VGM17_11060 [Rhizomicrobium sp.]